MELNNPKIKTAVAVFSFNRPIYLKQVLDSFEKNTSLDQLDFYLFQDGAINKFSGRIAANQQDIASCIELWDKVNLPNKKLIQHSYNIGIGICQFEAKEYLFDTMQYERCMFFEDDLVVSKYYFRTLKLMLDKFASEETVGAVMCYGNLLRKFSEEESLYFESVLFGTPQLWGWATWKEKWNRIKPAFMEYFQFIKSVDYRFRPTKEILEFYKHKGIKLKVSSQDAAFYYAMNKNSLFSLNTRLPRAKYIGAYGEHMRPAEYNNLGYDKTELLNSNKDALLEKFEGFDPVKAITSNLLKFAVVVTICCTLFRYSLSLSIANGTLWSTILSAIIYGTLLFTSGWYFGKKDRYLLPIHDVRFRFHLIAYLIHNLVSEFWFTFNLHSTRETVDVVHTVALLWGILLLVHFAFYLNARKNAIAGLSKTDLFE